MSITALTTDGQRVSMPVLPSAHPAELVAAALAQAHLADELHEACRPLVAQIGAELARLRAENAALRAENAVLHDEVQSLDFDLTTARDGRSGGEAR